MLGTVKTEQTGVGGRNQRRVPTLADAILKNVTQEDIGVHHNRRNVSKSRIRKLSLVVRQPYRRRTTPNMQLFERDLDRDDCARQVADGDASAVLRHHGNKPESSVLDAVHSADARTASQRIRSEIEVQMLRSSAPNLLTLFPGPPSIDLPAAERWVASLSDPALLDRMSRLAIGSSNEVIDGNLPVFRRMIEEALAHRPED
jgi:hypothetical protein